MFLDNLRRTVRDHFSSPQNSLGENSKEVHVQMTPSTPAPGVHDIYVLITIKYFRKLERIFRADRMAQWITVLAKQA